VTTSRDGADLLRSAGLRVTAPRLAVLAAIPRGQHLDADTVAQQVRARLGRVSTQAVYDVLHALASAGLLRRIELPGQASARYDRRVADNHHHLVCRSCGDVVDVDCATGEPPCLIPSDPHGYEVDEAEVVYWGRCPRCMS
jgi:Fe2+ or Zn2+ uptake regulation protein